MKWQARALVATGALLCAPAASAQERLAAVAGRPPALVGHVELDPRGSILVLDAAPSRATWLREVASRMNRKGVLHVEAAPPPGAPRFTSASRLIRRGEPEFVPALKDYLRVYYGIELRPG